MFAKYIAIALVCVLMGAFAVHTLTSIYQDIGRHLVLGEMIWKTESVPGTNPFSYTNPDFPFMNHHWLGEVFLYLAASLVGLKGLIALKAVLLAVTLWLVLWAFWRPGTALISVFTGLIAVFIIVERTDVRPEILSFLFLAWYLFVLYRGSQYPAIPISNYLLYSLPLVQAIWVNTHIYFFMGPLLFAAFAIGELAKGKFSTSTFNIRTLTLVGGAIALATFANPWGWRGALYPLFIFDNYGYSVMENKSTFFLKPFGYPQLTTYALYIGMLWTALGFALNYKNLRANATGLLAILVSGGLALYMVRNFPLFALVMVPVTVKNFYEAGVRINSYKLSVVSIIILLSLNYSVAKNQIYVQAGLGRRFGLEVPEGVQKAVDFVRSEGLKGPMFNNFDVGSFLIWKLPEEKVFIDGRPEAYPADFIRNVYIKMQENPALWKKYSEEYGIRFVFWNYHDITPWSRTFLSHISKNPDWPLVYKDGSIAIFVKR